MTPVFPPLVHELAQQHDISPALAFGLGEGLNLYYRRQWNQTPPHVLHVLPSTFAEKLEARLPQPRADTIKEALVANHYAVMVCTGDPHGLDAIEAWGENIAAWQLVEGWETSVNAAATLIEATDGLYRRGYGFFLDEAMRYHKGLAPARLLIDEIATDWREIAARLRRVNDSDDLERLSSRILRMAGRESRFWGIILDYFK